MSIPRLAVVGMSIALLGPALGAQELTHVDGLGSLSFPNSGATEAQEDFVRDFPAGSIGS